MSSRLTGRGAAVLVLGVVLLSAGLWWRYPGLVGLGGALLVLPAAALVAVLLPVRLTVARTVAPLEVTRHGRCEGTLRLARSGGRLALRLDAVDHVAGTAQPVAVPALARGGATEVTYPIPTARRGVLSVGPLLLRRQGLAGLASGTATVGGTVEVRVLPRVLPVRGLPSGAHRGHVGADERVEHGGTDLIGLREYVPGDDLRRLHWATSARTGRLMVREDADPSHAHLLVLLDDRAAGYRAAADVEDAVEVAASLAGAAAERGHPVRLLTLSGRLDVSVPDVGAHDLVARLAELSTVDGSGGLAPVQAQDRDVVVLVTGASADLAPLVLEAGRAGVGVVAVVDRDPARAVATVGPVTVLRGPRAEDLLHTWDRAVVGR